MMLNSCNKLQTPGTAAAAVEVQLNFNFQFYYFLNGRIILAPRHALKVKRITLI